MNAKRILQIAALIAMILVICTELGLSFLGSTLSSGANAVTGAMNEVLSESGIEPADVKVPEQSPSPPGKAIPALALVDSLLMLLMVFMTSRLIRGRVQVILTFILALLLLISSVILIFVTLALLLTMVSLLLAVPFGTIAYLAIWGSFAGGAARALLSTIMFCKLAFAVCLVVSDPMILTNRSMVALTLTSLVCTVIVGFLHGIVPSFLMSITDAIAAIVVAVIGAIWALIYLIRSGIATVAS